jgi:hypothetical protein
MLDAFIIEEIKRRERDRAVDDRPAIELPLPQPPEPSKHEDTPDEGDGRGVVIIDYSA